MCECDEINSTRLISDPSTFSQYGLMIIVELCIIKRSLHNIKKESMKTWGAKWYDDDTGMHVFNLFSSMYKPYFVKSILVLHKYARNGRLQAYTKSCHKESSLPEALHMPKSIPHRPALSVSCTCKNMNLYTSPSFPFKNDMNSIDSSVTNYLTFQVHFVPIFIRKSSVLLTFSSYLDKCMHSGWN